MLYVVVFSVLFVALAPLTICAAVCMESSQRSAYAAMQTESDEPADVERQPLLGGANAAAGAHRAYGDSN